MASPCTGDAFALAPPRGGDAGRTQAAKTAARRRGQDRRQRREGMASSRIVNSPSAAACPHARVLGVWRKEGGICHQKLRRLRCHRQWPGHWLRRSKRLASGRYLASLPIRSIRSATLCARAKWNGSASATKKGRRSRPRARQSSPVGSACAVDQPDPAAPISWPAFMRQVATTRRFLRSPGICRASLRASIIFKRQIPTCYSVMSRSIPRPFPRLHRRRSLSIRRSPPPMRAAASRI